MSCYVSLCVFLCVFVKNNLSTFLFFFFFFFFCFFLFLFLVFFFLFSSPGPPLPPWTSLPRTPSPGPHPTTFTSTALPGTPSQDSPSLKTPPRTAQNFALFFSVSRSICALFFSLSEVFSLNCGRGPRARVEKRSGGCRTSQRVRVPRRKRRSRNTAS